MSVAYEQNRAVTAEELYGPAFATVRRAELWQGEVVVLSPAGWRHNNIVLRLIILLHDFCAKHHTQWRVGGDADGFLLRRDPDLLLSPDVSIAPMDVQGEEPWLAGSLLLAVGVLSPSNSEAEMVQKRHWYFEAGAQQVWILNPAQRVLTVHHADGRRLVCKGGKMMCEGHLAGLQLDVDAILAEPAG